jgi:hypothetical protein
MSITAHTFREYVLVLTVAAATAAAGAGAILLSQNAAKAPSTKTVQLSAAFQPVSDAATGGYPTPYVIESDRGIIVVDPRTSAPETVQNTQSDALSRYLGNTATGPELVSDAALSH